MTKEPAQQFIDTDAGNVDAEQIERIVEETDLRHRVYYRDEEGRLRTATRRYPKRPRGFLAEKMAGAGMAKLRVPRL